MADSQSSKRLAVGVLAGLLVVGLGIRFLGRKGPSETSGPAAPSASASASVAPDAAAPRSVVSAPIAATHATNGDVIVAAFDPLSKYVRVRRIDAAGRVVRDRPVLGGVSWSNDADIKLSTHPTETIALTWRGLRRDNFGVDKLVRMLVVLDQTLIPQGEPTPVSGASCTTRDAAWLTDGAFAESRSWSSAPSRVALPKDDDVSLLCASTQAFAVMEGEERTSILPLVETDAKPSPMTVLRESDFGDDEQRDVSEYTVGDDVGVVRVGVSGNVAIRELSGGTLKPLHKLKTQIPKDDDVVAVDASDRVIVVVHTQDVSASCAPSDGSSPVSTKVSVLRVDRQTFDESTVEISPGRCGDEVGPFYTGAVGERVSVAWTERRGGPGRARAPIVGLAHALLGPQGVPLFARIEQPADALADAGCDANGCYAAALVPAEGAGDATVRVLRYNGK